MYATLALVGIAVKKITIKGQLRTCERLANTGKPPEYLVYMGDKPLEEYVAEQLPAGGYFSVTMRGANRTCIVQGALSVFMIKQITEYYENGWRAETET